MGDHYALRYSIDLTGSDQTPIGNTKDNAFKGKFDGLDNSIFGLSINNSDNSKGDATGLFGFTDGAIMGNVTLIAGNDGVSIQGGATDTGAFIGHAVNTTVKGVNSTLKVSGKKMLAVSSVMLRVIVSLPIILLMLPVLFNRTAAAASCRT